MQELEPSARQMRALLDNASDVVIRWLSQMDASAGDAEGREGPLPPVEPMPECGTDATALLEQLLAQVVERGVNTTGGAYQGYIPGGGLFSSAVAQFIAAATNRYVGVLGLAPGAVRIESEVIGWFRTLVGYSDTARGILTSGGSLANFSAVVAARCAHLPENFFQGTIYVSDQAHHSVQKAVMLAGFPARNVRVIPSDAKFHLRTDVLVSRIAEDRRAGFIPFLLVGTAGTTNTGAVDPLSNLATVAGREGMWFHVDAAYGGFFLLTERGRHLLAGIERADSITIDPHKGLFLPYGTGCLLARDGESLRRPHQRHANYLQDVAEDADSPLTNFADYSPELTRPFRGLGIWLPLKLAGAEAFRRCLDEKLDLAQWACTRLAEIPGVEIVAEPELSILAFRLNRGPGDLNELNRRLLAKINATGRTFLSSSVLADRVVIRIAILCFRTHEAHVRQALRTIRECLADL
jgi:aromatic-L-amino-acid decarboxylase